MEFDLPIKSGSPIKVIGVGGGGSNAVNYMHQQGIKGVDFIVCNTDNQALEASNVPIRIQLGTTLTAGQGAGSIPEIGKNAAIENLDDVLEQSGRQHHHGVCDRRNGRWHRNGRRARHRQGVQGPRHPHRGHCHRAVQL